MNENIEAHPQEVADIELLDEDNVPTRRVARRIFNDPGFEENLE